jgi:hypothetical protein
VSVLQLKCDLLQVRHSEHVAHSNVSSALCCSSTLYRSFSNCRIESCVCHAVECALHLRNMCGVTASHSSVFSRAGNDTFFHARKLPRPSYVARVFQLIMRTLQRNTRNYHPYDLEMTLLYCKSCAPLQVVHVLEVVHSVAGSALYWQYYLRFTASNALHIYYF